MKKRRWLQSGRTCIGALRGNRRFQPVQWRLDARAVVYIVLDGEETNRISLESPGTAPSLTSNHSQRTPFSTRNSLLKATMSTVRAESTFAYHGLDTVKFTDTETEVVKSLIKNFLEDVKFDRAKPLIKDPELEAAVWTYFKSQNLGQKTEKAVHDVLKLSTTLTLQAYTSLPFENKVLCAVQCLYMFLVDDIALSFLEELRHFCQK